MFHNNEGDQYVNSQALASSAGVYVNPPQCTSMYNNAQNFVLDDTQAEGSSLQAAGESEEDSSSSSNSCSSSDSSSSEHLITTATTTSSSLPCTSCLQTRCICPSDSNGFDPALLQLQLPQIALLMQQQGNDVSPQQVSPSSSSSSSTSFLSPDSPKQNVESLPSSLTQPPPFICQLCNEWFVVHEKLVLHLVVNHSMVYCKFCTRLFRSQAEHTLCLAHRGMLPCQVCNVNFRTNSSTTNNELAHHQRRMHDLHSCPLCGLTLRPKESYINHLKKRHHCKDCQLFENHLHLEGIVSEVSDPWSFHCKLCKKEIRKPELFGHFNTYHKLALPCLIELLHYGRIFISVQGYPATLSSNLSTEPSSSSLSSTNPSSSTLNNSGILSDYHNQQQQPQSYNSNCCNVCSKQYTTQVPKIAHDVFCSGMSYCQYCTLSFSSGLARELHLGREHSSLPCVSCSETFPAETSLTAHYARCHGAKLCCCCDELVPVTLGGLEDHLATRHGCMLPTNMGTLCNIGNMLACNLCLTSNKFTSACDDLPSIFMHLCQDHFIKPNKALNLLCRSSTNGVLSIGPPSEKMKEETNTTEIPQQNFDSKWNGSLTPNNNHGVMKEDDEEVSENMLVPQINLNAISDNESSGDDAQSSDDNLQDGEMSDLDEETNSSLLRRSNEPDVDPEDMDCISDSSEDEGIISHQRIEPLVCELCSEKNFTSTRHLCAHLFSIHKLHWDHKGQEESDAQYLCDLCGYKCSDKLELKTHKAQAHVGHVSAGTKCRFCPQHFHESEARNQHQLQSHVDQQMTFYRCPTCQLLASSTAALSRHILMCHPTESLGSGVRLKCRVCLFLYPSLSTLRAHFRAVHPAAMVFRCRHCSAHLKTRKTLRHHVKVVHAEARRRDCTTCGKVLWSKRAYAIHFRMKHSKTSKVGFRCRICQQRFDTKEQRKLHYTLDHEGESPYHCVDCGKGFASKSGMYGHRQLHTGSGVSKCEYCGKEFTRKDSYNEHLLIHNGPRHKCPHCPKEFVQRSNLVRHIRIHTGEKPYQCTFCEKRFSDKGACNSHIRVHTREETCSCPYCGQTFSKKQKLKYHIRKHTGEGLIECEICNKMFTNSFALKEHRVIHNRQTQVVCPQCGKGFNSEKYLQRHVAIVHEPSNAFSCPLCPKTFSQQARLKAHVMTHSGVKHMKCLLCEKAYSVRKSLRRHLLEKHEVSPEHPQYKHCFHAMSPEEAGLGLDVSGRQRRSSPRGTSTAPSTSKQASEPTSSSGRKRRRVEQIVQSLQHSLSTQVDNATASSSRRSPSPTLARINPLVINLPKAGSRKKLTVRARSKAELRKRHRKSRSSDDDEEDDSEGLNLVIVKPEGGLDHEVSLDS